jgi:hypothetical protein
MSNEDINECDNNILKNKFLELENQFKIIEKKLDKILEVLEKDCKKMNDHIDFVENVYDNVKMPFYYIMNKVNYLVSSDNKGILDSEHNNETVISSLIKATDTHNIIIYDYLAAVSVTNQSKLDLVARLGANWYTRANASTIFEVEKPNLNLGIGFDALPVSIKNSKILNGNDLGKLANVSELPFIDPSFHDDRLKNIIQYFSLNPDDMETELQLYAKELLAQNNVSAAWQILLASV